MHAGWEYMTITANVSNGHVHDDALDGKLTALGNQGWELTHVTPLTHEGKTTCLMHHLRRIAERQRQAGFQP
mgnify:CR=1 FL=1